jgi:hypothetical protein
MEGAAQDQYLASISPEKREEKVQYPLSLLVEASSVSHRRCEMPHAEHVVDRPLVMACGKQRQGEEHVYMHIDNNNIHMHASLVKMRTRMLRWRRVEAA